MGQEPSLSELGRRAESDPLLPFREYFRKSSPKLELTPRCMTHWAIVQFN